MTDMPDEIYVAHNSDENVHCEFVSDRRPIFTQGATKYYARSDLSSAREGEVARKSLDKEYETYQGKDGTVYVEIDIEDFGDICRFARAALRPAPIEGQPITDAPRDGTRVNIIGIGEAWYEENLKTFITMDADWNLIPIRALSLLATWRPITKTSIEPAEPKCHRCDDTGVWYGGVDGHIEYPCDCKITSAPIEGGLLEDLGRDTCDYLEQMYPEAWATMPDGMKRSLRNSIDNKIKAITSAAEGAKG